MQRATLLLLALAAALPAGPLAAQGFQGKPIRPLGCPQGERLLILAGPVQSPFVTYVRRTNWGSWLDGVMGGFAFGGVAGAASASGRSGYVGDQTEEFKAAVTAPFATSISSRRCSPRSSGT